MRIKRRGLPEGEHCWLIPARSFRVFILVILCENELAHRCSDPIHCRCAEERRQCESTDVEILQLQQKQNGKIEEEKQLSNLLAQNQRYQEYLKSVVEMAKGSSEDFTEIQDILDRYSTLKNTNDDLVTKMQINTKEHEARRSSYAHFMKKSGNEMLNMNNEIARLQKELEQVTIASNKIDSLDYGTCQNVNELTTEISQALLVIDNMVERLEFQAHPSLSQSSGAHVASKISSLMEERGLEMKVKNAVERLDGVADLIVDYESIAEMWSGKLGVGVVWRRTWKVLGPLRKSKAYLRVISGAFDWSYAQGSQATSTFNQQILLFKYEKAISAAIAMLPFPSSYMLLLG